MPQSEGLESELETNIMHKIHMHAMHVGREREREKELHIQLWIKGIQIQQLSY